MTIKPDIFFNEVFYETYIQANVQCESLNSRNRDWLSLNEVDHSVQTNPAVHTGHSAVHD